MLAGKRKQIQITLRFYGELNDLLASSRRGKTFKRSLPKPTTVKDLIESCGIPHTQVDLIIVNGKPTGFDHLIQTDEQVSIYPFFHNIDIPESVRLQPKLMQNPTFIADVNLGKLAKLLRMAGFDTTYRNNADDNELIHEMVEEQRVLLTRDRRLLMRKVVEFGFLVRSDDGVDQLEEVLLRFDLFDKRSPFSRCIHCNGMLEDANKTEILHKLEPLTRKYYDQFARCTACGKVYWPGSHRKRLQPKLKKILFSGNFELMTNTLTTS
jgi:uncharacterized protein with PIN domain